MPIAVLGQRKQRQEISIFYVQKQNVNSQSKKIALTVKLFHFEKIYPWNEIFLLFLLFGASQCNRSQKYYNEMNPPKSELDNTVTIIIYCTIINP